MSDIKTVQLAFVFPADMPGPDRRQVENDIQAELYERVCEMGFKPEDGVVSFNVAKRMRSNPTMMAGGAQWVARD